MENLLALAANFTAMHIAEFTDHTLLIIMYLNFALISLTGIVLLIAIYYRLRFMMRDRRRKSFAAVWQPVMEHCIYELPDSLPPLAAKELMNFLLLWNMMQENMKGEVRENLNFMARWLKIDGRIKRKMKSAMLYEQLMCINTVGLMRSPVLWDVLEDIVLANQQQILALAAAKALARINDKQAAAIVIPVIAVRTEWPLPAVASIIEQMRPEYVAEALRNVITRMPETMIPRLIRFLPFATKQAAIGRSSR